MARKPKPDPAVRETECPRVRKRRRRIGPKRACNLVMLDDLVMRLEVSAARQRTTPAELVQDWIEEHTPAIRLRTTAGPGGDPEPEAPDAA